MNVQALYCPNCRKYLFVTVDLTPNRKGTITCYCGNCKATHRIALAELPSHRFAKEETPMRRVA